MLPPVPERSWTEQPGGESEWLSVDVLGASAEVQTVTHNNTVAAVNVEKAAAAVSMGQSIVRLRDYQAEAVEAVFKAWESGKKAPLIVAATGCHAKGQDILMFNGSVKSVESILPGDQLMGPDGTPRTVLTLCRGKGRMVTVIPGDRFQRAGRKPWVVNEDHVLTLQWSRYSPTSWMLVDRKVSTVLSIHPLNRSSALLAMVYADPSDPKDRSRWQLDYDFELEYTGTTEDYYGFTLDGDRRYLLDDGTVTHNSGKTILAAEIMRRSVEPHLWKRALFIAHRKELLDQTVAKAKLVAPRCTVGLVQAETNELERRITVASVQTLAARKGERLAQVMGHQPPRLVVVDEAHHATSPTWVRVLDQIRAANPDVLFLGLTATPGRADGTGLDKVFDCVAYEKNLFDLVRDGYLVPPRGIRVNLDISLDSVDSKNGDFVESQLAQVINQPSVRRATVRAWQEHGHDRKMIVFCCNVQHARDLAQEFSDAGYPAAAIDGGMKQKDRNVVYERFRSGHLKLLCSVEVLTEGWDEPSAEGVIFARPTASQSLYSQCLDYETEILTKRGWVGPTTISDDDIVATMDPETERCVWSPVLSRVDRPMHEREKMYAIKLPGLDIRVTGNHRMIYKQRRDMKPMWTVASQVPKCFTAIVSVLEEEGAVDCSSVTDDELSLLGWFYSDGSWNKITNQLVFHQSARSPFVREIEDLVRRCGLKFGRLIRRYDTQFKSGHEMLCWYVSHGDPRGTQKEMRGWKHLGRWISRDGTKKPTDAFYELSSRQWRIFLEAFNRGDGARMESKSINWDPQTWSIYQKPGTGLHDVFQALCVTRGMRCNLGEHSNSPGEYSKLSIAPDKRYHTVNGSRPELTMRQVDRASDERVWCVETSTGTIITRRNGKVAVVGNCLGRGLRLYPGKTECLVIDLVGNSDRHSPVQLASLAGLRPVENENLPDGLGAPKEEEEEVEAHVSQMRAREFDFRMRAKRSRYAWRETTYGWTLQIPRVGYFLVAWHDADKSRATVRFHDLREGRRDSAPIEVVKTPLDFDMAYGLVEGEVERLTAPRAKRPQDEAQAPPAFAFLYEDGLEEDAFVAERLLLNDADWRAKPMTPKQADALRKLGVKDKSLPQTAGEAADLITVMNVEFDVKMREPATDKQMWYLRCNKIPHERGLTKNAAKRLILAHRAQNGGSR